MDQKSIYEKMKKGTTTVGIICDDGVVVGADSRATMDTFIATQEAVKVYKINDTLAMTIAGGVGDAEYLIKLVSAQDQIYAMEEKKSLSPRAATSLLSIVLQENKMYPFMVQLIMAGFTNGTPELYDMDPLGGYTKESHYTSTGSGSLTALGYLESVYQENLSVQEGIKHVAKALSIAMRRDSATGGNMKIISITKKGYKEYTKDEIEKISKAA